MEFARFGIVLAGACCIVSLAIGFFLGRWIGSLRLRPAAPDLNQSFAELVRRISSSQKELQNSTIQYLDKYTNATIDKQNEIIHLLNRLHLEDLADAIGTKKIDTPFGRSGDEKRESSKATEQNGPLEVEEPAASSTMVGGLDLNPTSFAKASDVGERALVLLENGGRTSAIASVEGLEDWIRTSCVGFVAEPLLQSEGCWLIAVVSRINEDFGAVIPALDTVIGAGMILDWFECRGYDGTRVLQRRHVIDLAEAIRDQERNGWRVKKKGLISREATGGGA